MSTGGNHIKPYELFTKRPKMKYKGRKHSGRAGKMNESASNLYDNAGNTGNMDGGAARPSVTVSYDDMEDTILPEGGIGVIVMIVAVAVGGFLLWSFVIKPMVMKGGMTTLGSGGESGGIPNPALMAPEIHDNPDSNMGHGLAYGTYEYDIYGKTGRQREIDQVTDWMQEDIEKDRKTQALQIPTIPGHPAGGGPWLLGKDWVGDFEKQIRIPEIPGHQKMLHQMKSDAVRNEYNGLYSNGALRDNLKNPNYILSKIHGQAIDKKNMQGSKANKHIEKMKEEIAASGKISADDAIDIALRRDSPIVA